MRENLRVKVRKDTLILTGALASLAVVFTGVAKEVDHTDPVSTFNRHYTGDNDCLHNTPFDPSQDAIASAVEINGQKILAVLRRDPNSASPAALMLQVYGHGLAEPTFMPGDYATATYLADQHCPGATDGM